MRQILTSILAALAGVVLPLAVAAQPAGEYSGYGPHMMWGGGWFGWILGPLIMVLIVGGIIVAVVFLARSLGRHTHPAHGPSHRPDPLDILKERFARGEIDKEEYEDRRRVLGE